MIDSRNVGGKISDKRYGKDSWSLFPKAYRIYTKYVIPSLLRSLLWRSLAHCINIPTRPFTAYDDVDLLINLHPSENGKKNAQRKE